MTEPQPEARALHLSAKSTRARQLVERLLGPGDETVEPLPGPRLARRLFTHYQVRLQQLRDRRAPEPPDQDDAGGAKQRSRQRDQGGGAARAVGEPCRDPGEQTMLVVRHVRVEPGRVSSGPQLEREPITRPCAA